MCVVVRTDVLSRVLNLIPTAGNKWVGNYDNSPEVLASFKKNIYAHLEKDRIFYGSRMGLGDDLPYGPGKEWTSWL